MPYRLGAALLAGLAFALVATGTSAGLVTHFLIGKLVYSTSNGATLYFLGFAVLALAWSAAGHSVSPRLAWLLALCLVLGHGANLAASLHYFQEHNLPLDAHVHHWLERDNSYTSLLHSHLGKPSLALGANMLGLATGAYDTGIALGDSLSGGVTRLIGGSFILGLSVALALFPGVMARLEWHPAALILYLVTASLCLKTLLDGGPLSYRVPPSALVLASLIFAPDRAGLARFWRGPGWKLALLITVAYLLVWMRYSAERPIPAIGGLLFTLAAYGLLLNWLCDRVRWRVAAPLLIYLAVNTWVDARLNLLPYLEHFGPQHRVAVLADNGGVEMPATPALQGRPLHQVYAHLGDDPLKPRRVLLWREPATGHHELESAIQLLDVAGQVGALKATQALTPTDMNRLATDRVALRVEAPLNLAPILVEGEGDALSRANYYVYLHALNGLLRRAGWREYILIPATASNPLLD